MYDQVEAGFVDELRKLAGHDKSPRPEDFNMMALSRGVKVELNAGADRDYALKTAMVNLSRSEQYYDADQVGERELDLEKQAKLKALRLGLKKLKKAKSPRPLEVKTPGRKIKSVKTEAQAHMKKFLKSQG
ncbi:hypothetical protein DRQ25_18240 [Candidatus Fermentibacteria bacterium]|nr:MAG: hypothetical protein DRQ25_18240 [Candidatus Fermentibacteria bacterium]